jgi:hypothetical protein
MTPNQTRPPFFDPSVSGLILAFALISFGGLLLHVRIHPPAKSAFNWIGTLVPLANLTVLPFLFNRPTTAAWAVLFTWATALTGTATMAYHSITTWEEPLTVANVILKSTFPDILILWTKVPLALAILVRWREREEVAPRSGCQP